jgi:hypothetical protein
MTVIKMMLTYFYLGCLTDYYIAVGLRYLGNKNFPKKSYFWCTGDSMRFSELPESLGQQCGPLFD